MKNNILKLFFLFVLIILVVIFWRYVMRPLKTKKTITFFNWGEFIDNQIIDDFNKENDDFEVKQNFFVSNELAINKVKAGNNYDIVILSEYAIEQLKKENYLATINLSDIIADQKHLQELQIKDFLTDLYNNNANLKEIFFNHKVDNQKFYSIPYVWGSVGLLYRKDKFAETDFNDAKWKNLLEDVNHKIALYNNPKEALFIGLKATNGNMQNPSPTDIQRAKEWLINIKTNNKQLSFVTDQILDNMKDKSHERYDIAVVYSGDADYLMKENDNLGYYVFNDGNNIFIDGIVIPQKNYLNNKEGIDSFLRYLLKKENLKRNYQYIGYYSPYKMDNGNDDISVNEKKIIENSSSKDVVYKYNPLLNIEVFKAWDEIYAKPIQSDKWIFIFSFGLLFLFFCFNFFFYYNYKDKKNL